MAEENEQSQPKDQVSSAPPVESGLLRQHKLRPLSVPSPKVGDRDADPNSDQSLPEDITDNEETDRAVDAVSSSEADIVLETEDARRSDIEQRMPKHRLRAFFSAWLCTKKGWEWTVVVLFFGAAALAAVPAIRYWALNEMGVKCSLSVSTMDGNTQLDLPGVTVSDGSAHATTNSGGYAVIHNLKLGTQTLTLARPGFATQKMKVVLGWGSNPQGSFNMKSVGQEYTIQVRDFLTGAGLPGASANSDGLAVLGDKSGKITLTVSDNASEQPIPVTVTAPGYATANITLSGTSTAPVTVSLVPSQKEVYVSKGNGTYNLYSSYIDGSSKGQLLAGTSTETSNISLAVSPDGSQVAMVSTRDPSYDSSGTLLETLSLVNTGDGTPLTLDHGQQIQLIGWTGTTIVYEIQTTAGSSPNYNIISYNYSTNSRNQLASSSQFVGVTLAAGSVYYGIPAAASTTNNGFFSIQANGSGKQTIIPEDIWSVLRSSYTDFSVQSAKSWYDYSVGGSAAQSLSSAPANLGTVTYIDSPDGKLSASVDNGQIKITTVSTGKSTTLTAGEPSYPLRWLNASDLIYRVTNGTDSSDYVVNINTNDSKQITSVTNATSVGSN